MARNRFPFVACIVVFASACSHPAEKVSVHGLEGRYSLRYVSQSRVDLSSVLVDANKRAAGAGESQSVTTDISGTWQVVPLRQDGTATIYEIRLADALLSVTSGEQKAAGLEEIRGQLGQNFLAKLTPEGRVIAVRFGATWGGNARDIAKSLLSLAQFVGPGSNGLSDGWDAQEDYFGGQYSTRYKVIARSPKIIEIEKERKAAFATTSAKGMMASHREPSGRLKCEVDRESGVVTGMAGDQFHAIFVSDNRVGTESVKFALKRLGPAPKGSAELAKAPLDATEPWFALSEFNIAPDQKLAMAKQTLGGATKETLLSDIGKARGSGISSESIEKLRNRLTALFEVEPRTCQSFVSPLAGDSAYDPAFQAVVGSLVHAGNREAQLSLVAIAQQSDDHEVRGVLISWLTPIERPEPELIGFIERQTTMGDEKLAQASWFSYGVMASALAKQDPVASATLVKKIAAQWERSVNPRDRATYVLALGNSASPEAMPAIRISLQSKDLDERRSAVQALAKFRSPDSVALLVERITSDVSPLVRAAAMSQLRWQAYDAAIQNLLDGRLKVEKEASVRLAALEFLKGRTLGAELSATVSQLAKSDPSQEVRAAAAFLLTG